MKLPNGFGSVYKLSGKRCHPWVASKTFGWELNEQTGKAKQIQKPIGYFATKQEAVTALVHYNENPYDLNAKVMTFSDVYEKWSDSYFPTLGNNSNMTYTGGLKTDAGKNRIVPIHPIVSDLVKKNYDQAVSIGSDHLFNDLNGQQGTSLTYDKYRGRWKKIMKRFDLDHRPHDTRHTFITC